MTGKQVSVKSLDQINSNMNVGMEDVVNVFISRHEDALHSQREQLQGELKTINGQIADVTSGEVKRVTALVKMNGSVIDNEVVRVEVGLRDDSVQLDWEKKVINYQTEITTKSKTVLSGYNNGGTQTVVGKDTITQAAMVQYGDLMSAKGVLTEKLTIVNNGLRDLARKERKVRGIIAEKKLNAMGMEDLLGDQQLLALIDGSSD